MSDHGWIHCLMKGRIRISSKQSARKKGKNPLSFIDQNSYLRHVELSDGNDNRSNPLVFSV